MDLPEEEHLLERARKGDVEAFEALISRYERKVYNLAYRMIGNHEDASDMAQEAFVRVYTRLSDFRGESSFLTWLTRIVHNVCADELRRRRRHPVSSLDRPVEAEDGELVRQLADGADGPEESAERRELQTALQRAIAELDVHFRSILILRDVQGLSYNEIAEVLGENLGTVKSRLNRARHALKNQLAAHMELLSPQFVYRARRRQGNEL